MGHRDDQLWVCAVVASGALRMSYYSDFLTTCFIYSGRSGKSSAAEFRPSSSKIIRRFIAYGTGMFLSAIFGNQSSGQRRTTESEFTPRIWATRDRVAGCRYAITAKVSKAAGLIFVWPLEPYVRPHQHDLHDIKMPASCDVSQLKTRTGPSVFPS